MTVSLKHQFNSTVANGSASYSGFIADGSNQITSVFPTPTSLAVGCRIYMSPARVPYGTTTVTAVSGTTVTMSATVSGAGAFEYINFAVDNKEVQPGDWNAEHTLTMGSGKLLGRSSSGTGAAEEISVGSGLLLSGGDLVAIPNVVTPYFVVDGASPPQSGTWADLTGNGNNLDAYGTEPATSTDGGGSMVFDGTGLFTTPYGTSDFPSPTTYSGSYEVWVKFASFTSQYQTLFGLSGGSYPVWVGTNNDQIEFENDYFAMTGGTLVLDEWTHVVCTTEDGGGGDYIYKMYINGKLIVTATDSTPPPVNQFYSAKIGAAFITLQSPLDGKIAYVRAYDGLLTQADILSLYSASLARFQTPGGGTGAVSSVNTQTGVVTIDYTDPVFNLGAALLDGGNF